MTIPWVGAIWTLSSLFGAVLTGRELELAWGLWRTVGRRTIDEAIRITVFGHVRTGSLLVAMHLAFICVGIIILSAPPAPLPTSWEEWATVVILLSVPLMLIVIAAGNRADRIRLRAIARHGLP